VKERPFDSETRKSSEYRLYLRGSDISRDRITPLEPRYLKYGPWLAEPRPAAEFDAQEKILMRQTGDSLVATIDRDQYLCLNNMHVLVPKTKDISLPLVLGILNSRLLNWYYHTLNPEEGEALAEVKKANIARLPIVIPQTSVGKEKKLGERLGQLVQQMLDLHQRLAEVKTEHEKTALRRQIDATDRQIDQLVYELYSLTPEEIRLVEQSTS
jgi:hypothetical protein